MKANLRKQDRNGVRSASELQRRYKFQKTQEQVEEVSEELPSLNEQIQNKVDKVPGKDLSTNDFNNTYKQNVDDNTTARHTHNNITELDGITSTDISNWNSASGSSHTHSNMTELDEITATNISDWNGAKTKTDATSYNLEDYKVTGLTILRSSCIVKNNRAVINFAGTFNIAANTTTTIFNLPDELKPTATKDFVIFGQTNNNDGYIGYGYITNTGIMQVRFAQAITSYMRFSIVYDLD